MVRHLFVPALVIASLATFPTLSQQAGGTIKTAESQQYGQYLVDGEERAVYLFTIDTQGQGDTKEAVSNCHDACAQAWPPVLSEAEPQAEGAAQAELLGRIERKDGGMQVTYNGWPLYYFIQDQGAGQTTGQDVEGFGGEWYLIGAEGEKIGHE